MQLTAAGLATTVVARDLIGERLARRYSVLPLTATSTTIEIATADPFDIDCEATIAFATGRNVVMRLASPLRIAERLDEIFPAADRIAGFVADALPPDVEQDDSELVGEEVGDQESKISGDERPVIRLVDHIIARGIEERASDVHLEPRERDVSVRFRVDGVLRDAMTLPRAVGLPLVSRIKIMASLDIADRLRPQGGRARATLNGVRVDLRVSTLPAAHGEKVVVRILDARATLQTFEGLGLDNVDGPRLAQLLDIREGLVLVTGPTGSGKTTTLYAALKRLLDRALNIITVEDPVEYRIPGIVQVQINEKAGMTFATALRSILRQDPDVVFIGEIRDRETAAIAIQASLTGHLVLATLHTNDACSSITRLADLGVDLVKLASAVKGIVAQRLVRRLCAACRIVAPGGVPRRLRAVVPDAAMVHIPIGCGDCGLTGFQGRTAIMEIVIASAGLEREIAAGSPTDALAAEARLSGSRSLWESGIAQVLDGKTSIDELFRVVSPPVNCTQGDFLDPPSSRVREAATEWGQDSHRDPLWGLLLPDDVTRVHPGVVDVYLLRPSGSGFEVLLLQRAVGTRCTGAWETVHGNLEAGERPEEGAVREVREETGLTIEKLYNVTVQPFFLHAQQTVQLAIVFAAFVRENASVTLGSEHQKAEWLEPAAAMDRFAWPRERQALDDVLRLVGKGDAGAVEDVLRVF